MKEFTLMTDVNTDVEPEYAAKEGIVIMPQYYYFEDGIIYGDEIKLEPDEFYKRLANGEVAKSSGCNPGKVREMFEAELDKGKDILAIICTSGLSGSFNTCHSVADELMEERPDAKIMRLLRKYYDSEAVFMQCSLWMILNILFAEAGSVLLAEQSERSLILNLFFI